MRKFVMEFIGTFFLVLTIGFSIPAIGAWAPLAIGVILTVMVYAGGHISGAHYNPAVTIGVWLRKKCSLQEVPLYIAAQLLGGVLAGFSVLYTTGVRPSASPLGDPLASFIVEFLFTFALVFVVLF